ncbi:MAG TPA: PEP-CTERM sorting domain-containing protein, partial [Erythrobacter sp.]|nr:PEP-CTERM sorting domain-containing protein [Erythrobacter sp.]
MSVKSALAKLSATAAGGALLAGGAVHVAERPITDNPQYKSKSVKQAKYVKQATPRAVPRPTVPRARTIPRQVECVPADSAAAANNPNNICPP